MNKFRSDLEKTVTFFTFMLIGIILTIVLIIVKGDPWMYAISGSFIIIGLIFFILNFMKVKETNNQIKLYKKEDYIPNNISDFFKKEYYQDKLDSHISSSSKYDIKAESLYNIGDKYIDVLIIYKNMKIMIGLDSLNVYYRFEELEDDKYKDLMNNLNKMYQLTKLQIFKPNLFEKMVYGDNSDFKLHLNNKDYYTVYNELGEFIDKKIEMIDNVLKLYEESKEKLK